MFAAIPLIAVALILYFVVIYSTGLLPALDAVIIESTMLSGGVFSLTMSDLIIGISLVLLFIELVKATRTHTGSIINHGLSMLVFVLCVGAFLTIPEAATSTFFMIMLVALLDVVAGFTVTIATARRDFAVGE